MIRLANLLQAPTVSIYQLVKTKTFALYLFDMVKWIKWNEIWDRVFTKIASNFKLYTATFESSILDIWRDPECTFGRMYITTLIKVKSWV